MLQGELAAAYKEILSVRRSVDAGDGVAAGELDSPVAAGGGRGGGTRMRLPAGELDEVLISVERAHELLATIAAFEQMSEARQVETPRKHHHVSNKGSISDSQSPLSPPPNAVEQVEEVEDQIRPIPEASRYENFFGSGAIGPPAEHAASSAGHPMKNAVSESPADRHASGAGAVSEQRMSPSRPPVEQQHPTVAEQHLTPEFIESCFQTAQQSRPEQDAAQSLPAQEDATKAGRGLEQDMTRTSPVLARHSVGADAGRQLMRAADAGRHIFLPFVTDEAERDSEGPAVDETGVPARRAPLAASHSLLAPGPEGAGAAQERHASSAAADPAADTAFKTDSSTDGFLLYPQGSSSGQVQSELIGVVESRANKSREAETPQQPLDPLFVENCFRSVLAQEAKGAQAVSDSLRFKEDQVKKDPEHVTGGAGAAELTAASLHRLGAGAGPGPGAGAGAGAEPSVPSLHGLGLSPPRPDQGCGPEGRGSAGAPRRAHSPGGAEPARSPATADGDSDAQGGQRRDVKPSDGAAAAGADAGRHAVGRRGRSSDGADAASSSEATGSSEAGSGHGGPATASAASSGATSPQRDADKGCGPDGLGKSAWRDGAGLVVEEVDGDGGLVSKGDIWLPSFLPVPSRKVLPWDRR